jgi:protein-L-isoaspartate(D-aspartate) O-methyltransferase
MSKQHNGLVHSGSIALVALVLAACGCRNGERAQSSPGDSYAMERKTMIERQLRPRGIKDPLVLAAMEKVPRHRFVPDNLRASAYADGPLPIGLDQTISQPYVVAAMTEAARLRGGERVLEVGTGSGYQAAVLAEIAGEVYSIEILDELARRAAAALAELGYRNVHVKTGDGYQGWPDAAPFDAILVTAAPDHVPAALKQQLKVGARLVLPVGGTRGQELLMITRIEDGWVEERLFPVLFVPMTGEAERR